MPMRLNVQRKRLLSVATGAVALGSGCVWLLSKPLWHTYALSCHDGPFCEGPLPTWTVYHWDTVAIGVGLLVLGAVALVTSLLGMRGARGLT